jgi:hypothetical protein
MLLILHVLRHLQRVTEVLSLRLRHLRPWLLSAVPPGGVFLIFLFTDGLRRGLYSFAALRLGFGGSSCALPPPFEAPHSLGLKPASICDAYAALKRRSSTVARASVAAGKFRSRSRPKSRSNPTSKATDRSFRSTRPAVRVESQQQVPHRAFGPVRNDKRFDIIRAG